MEIFILALVIVVSMATVDLPNPPKSAEANHD
ncbi:MAG: hypothetical protein RL661_955 [Pseudomonadota bacterium]|jgi:hypothetical protein